MFIHPSFFPVKRTNINVIVDYTALQGKGAVSAYLTSKQILPLPLHGSADVTGTLSADCIKITYIFDNYKRCYISVVIVYLYKLYLTLFNCLFFLINPIPEKKIKKYVNQKKKKKKNDNIIHLIAYFISINANLWTDFKLMNIYV